jgi:hypothetical protein
MSNDRQTSQQNEKNTNITDVITNPMIDNYTISTQIAALSGKVNDISDKVNASDKRANKSIIERSTDLVTKYFDPNKNQLVYRILGWGIMGIWYYLFNLFFYLLYRFIVFLFYLIIFLLLFIPLMCIGIVFMILILVMINIWMSSKSFLDALIQVINPIIPVPLIVWNIIAAVFNAIGAIARKFGGRLPRMPTVRNPNAYKIRKGVPSIYAIIDFIVRPLEKALWRYGEKKALELDSVSE